MGADEALLALETGKAGDVAEHLERVHGVHRSLQSTSPWSGGPACVDRDVAGRTTTNRKSGDVAEHLERVHSRDRRDAHC
jgi:hypothetical protein